MTIELRSPGQTTVSPEVLLAIARLTALKVEGVHAMSTAPRARGGQREEGVQVRVEGDRVDLDLYLILEHDVNLRQVSRDVQTQVARAISEMVGMEAGRIDVHIEDIFYPAAS